MSLISRKPTGGLLTPKRVPKEYSTSFESSSYFTNPEVIEIHPLRPILLGNIARLCTLPEIVGPEISPCLEGVNAPSTTGGELP